MDAALNLVRHSGNEALMRAVELSLVAATAGVPFHVHAEGLRGTGKTTVMRAVRSLLPPIRRVRGCLYNCDPDRPHCPHHRDLEPGALHALGEEWVPMPFLEIAHAAKVGTVVGTIDLARLVDPAQPAAALLPGTIPRAHRGILFVDEVNRLVETAPELVDILLDVMGTRPGRVQIEESGLPTVEMPVQVTVWAASNPDEDPGPLEEVRRQLSDRFDLTVYTDRPTDLAAIEQILALGEGAPAPLAPEAKRAFQESMLAALVQLRAVELGAGMRGRIAELYSRFGLESLRAAQGLQHGMRLLAATRGQRLAGLDELAAIIPHVLRHRVEPETLQKAVALVESWRTGESGVRRPPVEVAAPPSPSTAVDPAVSESWLSRTLEGLRKNIVGAEVPPHLPPRQGALFARVGDGSGPRGSAPSPAAAEEGSVNPLDPLDVPVVSPPRLARPIRLLPPEALLQTEEELGRL
ncbi:MAG TPA: magnesium chelatase [Symbiobacteriaceae bacterium]|nr:magnesium chelatase [Symbiobacteriaceae bacterium]